VRSTGLPLVAYSPPAERSVRFGTDRPLGALSSDHAGDAATGSRPLVRRG